jgi:prolyl oligopeptidase
LDAAQTAFFDPNTLSTDGTVSLKTYGFSESGKFFAYGLSSSGSDWTQIHVKGTQDGDKDLEEKPLEWAKFTGIQWTHDDKGFFYSRYPTPAELSKDKAGTETEKSKNHMVMYHRVGTKQEEDICCFKDFENVSHVHWVSLSSTKHF